LTVITIGIITSITKALKPKQRAVRQKYPKTTARSTLSVFSPGAGGTTRTYVRAKGLEVANSADRIIFSSLLVLIGLAAVPYGSIEPWWEGIFESAIFMLGACCIVTSTTRKRWHLPAMLAPIVGLILLGCLQRLPLWHTTFRSDLLPPYQTVSVDPFETTRFVIKLLAVALTLAMLVRYATTRTRLLALMHLVIIVGAASAVFAIWRWLLPATAFTAVWDGKLQEESFGQFMNRNHFALLMEMSLGPVLGLASCSGHGLKRYLYTATAFFLCLALIIANSRGGIISMLGQLGFLSWMYFGRVFDGSFSQHHPRRKHRGSQWFWRRSRMFALRCVLSLLLLGAAFSIVLWLGGEPVRHRLESVPSEFLARRGDPENRSPRRLEIWGATWRLIRRHPLLGSGFGAYKTAITQYFRPSSDWQPQQAHNEYLELVAGGGVIGGALGFWFVLILIRDALRRLHEIDPLRRAVCLGALVGLVGVAIHSLVDFGLHVMVNALVCCVLVVLATAKIRSEHVKSQSLVI
jgi:O-antigen ligase